MRRLASDTPSHLAWATSHLGQGASTPFAAGIADRYQRGAGWLIAVDAAPVIQMAAGDDAPPIKLAGMAGVKYLFLEQRAPGGADENEVTLTFQDARTGMASLTRADCIPRRAKPGTLLARSSAYELKFLRSRAFRLVVRNAEVAIDACHVPRFGFGVASLRALRLLVRIHCVFVMAVPALERIVDFHARPDARREGVTPLLELLTGIDVTHQVRPEVVSREHLRLDERPRLVRHMAVRADRAHA